MAVTASIIIGGVGLSSANKAGKRAKGQFEEQQRQQQAIVDERKAKETAEKSRLDKIISDKKAKQTALGKARAGEVVKRRQRGRRSLISGGQLGIEDEDKLG